jgi:hypothetical protein
LLSPGAPGPAAFIPGAPGPAAFRLHPFGPERELDFQEPAPRCKRFPMKLGFQRQMAPELPDDCAKRRGPMSPRETIKRHAIQTGRRVLAGAPAWLLLGVVLGVQLAGRIGPGWIGVLAGATAGAIVLSILGIAVSIAGGHGSKALFGGLLGCLAGLMLDQFQGVSASQHRSMGLIMGALAGTTAWPMIRGLARVASRLIIRPIKILRPGHRPS